MNQYLYEIYYLFKNKNYHILIIADSDEKCYELALKNIKEEHLSELDKLAKELFSISYSNTDTKIDPNALLSDERLFKKLKSYLFHTIRNSKRYFLEESSVLKIDESK
jgi:hypothetical protein